jgi:hypothetical protein
MLLKGSGAAGAAFALLAGLVVGFAPAATGTPAPAAVAPADVKQTQPAERRGYWGAIKLAKDGTTGKATNRRTARRAERAAARRCRQDTPFRCDMTSTTFSHSCGAIAIRMRRGTVVLAVGQSGQATKRRAARAAVRSCESDGGNCRLAAAVCTRGRG